MPLKAREFLFHTEDLALAALPPGFPRPERKVMWTILQFHYGDPRVHFELQPQPSRGLIELGLHFEGEAEFNDRWAALVADRTPAVMAALGDGWELEQWTPSWRRLHRVWTFAALTPELAREVAEQLALAVQVLKPLIDEGQALIPKSPVRAPIEREGQSERWRRTRERRERASR